MTDPRIRTAPPAPERSVLICDDRPAARKALAHLLTPAAGAGGTVGAVADEVALVEALAVRPTELVLIGLRRGGPTRPTAVDLLLTPNPAAAVIVYGTSADTDLLAAGVTRGARGLMLWEPDRQLPAPPAFGLSARPVSGPPGDTGAALSDRELQVLLGMSKGRSNGEIGQHLFLSEYTVKTLARRLFAKLDARDRAHAVARGLQAGLFS
jgi:DNA-binding NarL/FixJ family response regulator